MSGLNTDSELAYLARTGAGAMVGLVQKGLGNVVVEDKKGRVGDNWTRRGYSYLGNIDRIIPADLIGISNQPINLNTSEEPDASGAGAGDVQSQSTIQFTLRRLDLNGNKVQTKLGRGTR